MQHPVTNEYHESRKHIEETFSAMLRVKKPVLWFWPNVDAGADGTSKGIRSFRENNPDNPFHFFKNMEPHDFLKLLINSDGLIGNSSVGIRECAFLGVPVVNIGSRQERRDRGGNVKDVGYQSERIYKAIDDFSSEDRPAGSGVYGGGDAGKKIADLLSTVPLIFHKIISY